MNYLKKISLFISFFSISELSAARLNYVEIDGGEDPELGVPVVKKYLTIDFIDQSPLTSTDIENIKNQYKNVTDINVEIYRCSTDYFLNSLKPLDLFFYEHTTISVFFIGINDDSQQSIRDLFTNSANKIKFE